MAEKKAPVAREPVAEPAPVVDDLADAVLLPHTESSPYFITRYYRKPGGRIIKVTETRNG